MSNVTISTGFGYQTESEKSLKSVRLVLLATTNSATGVCQRNLTQEVLAIRRTFSLVDMITNTKFSNCSNVFKIGVA